MDRSLAKILAISWRGGILLGTRSEHAPDTFVVDYYCEQHFFGTVPKEVAALVRVPIVQFCAWFDSGKFRVL
jgi:hypothetical protein